jgi:hypothetical protein
MCFGIKIIAMTTEIIIVLFNINKIKCMMFK